MQRKRGFMNPDLYKKIVKEAVEFGFKQIDLRVYGEPLIDVELENKAKFASEQGFEYIMINTNGALLTKDRFEKLAESRFARINVSISPKRAFERTRPGKSFDKIWRNLTVISNSRYKDIIRIWVVLTKQTTDEEIQEFDLEVKSLGYKNINYTHETRHIANINSGTAPIIRNNINCYLLLKVLTVYWDGSIALCPVDYENNIKLGNLNDKSLKELINSEKFKKIRYNHLKMNYLNICKRCDNGTDTFYEIFKGIYDLSDLNYPYN